MSETMKDVPNYEGKYAVTPSGKIWSYKHKKFLKPKVVRGYEHVDLFDKDKHLVQWLVHRLVAVTYLSNPDNLPCVNHKDECKTNNNVSNLEWCSYKYNSNYGTRKQRAIESYGSMGKCWDASISARSRAVRCLETGVVYCSITEASKSIGVNRSHIGDCCLDKRKTAGGYHWEYVDKKKKPKYNICGIYGIHNIVTDEWYIGQSKNTAKRIGFHFHELKYNKHSNKDLQKSYNKYGADAFYTTILEECNESELDILEEYWIEAMCSIQKGFNRLYKGKRHVVEDNYE